MSLPLDEIEVFKELPDLKVIFDVGSRDDFDYLEIYPNIEYHIFEPNPIFFKNLQENLKSRRLNVYLNSFGLSNKEGEEKYSDSWQAFQGGENTNNASAWDRMLPLKTLDQYIRSGDIKEIDFLKIDTEGYDFKVLLGGKDTLPRVRFLQYEHWNDKAQFHALLGEHFDMEYIGGRNVLCMNKKLVNVIVRNKLRLFLSSHQAKHGYVS